MRNNNQQRLPSNTFLILIFLLPILRYYNLGGTGIKMESLMTLLALCIGVILVFSMNSQDKQIAELRSSKRWFAAFGTWAILITFAYELFTNINITNFNANHTINVFIVMIINIILIYIILKGCFDIDSCLRIYIWIVYFLIALYCFQWVLYATGTIIDFKLPFMKFTSSWGFLENKLFGMSPYPRALFSEKAHLSQYLVPYIALCLFSNKIIKRHRIEKAIIVSAVVISTISGNGIIVVGIEWFVYFLFFKQITKNRRIIYTVLGFLLIAGLYYILSNIPSFSSMFSILFSSETVGTSSKADYRIYRGFDMFRQLPWFAQLFGVGNDHMYLFSLEYGISSIYDRGMKGYEYFSAWFETAIYYGLVGLFLSYKHLITLFKMRSIIVKGLIIVVAALWMSTEMIFTNFHIMYVLIIVAVVVYEKRGNWQYLN